MQTTEKPGFIGLSRTIVVLGFVSLFTDLSSEMLIPILPIFLSDILKVAPTAIGVIEGVAEFTASFLRIFAGWLADKLGRPKLLTVLGYGLSSIAKPFLVFARVWPDVLLIRFTERLGKGIRSAPRDVIIAESVEAENRGRAFSFHRAMDTTGAVIGPLVAYAILRMFEPGRQSFNVVFLAATVPAIIGVIILVVFVPERPKEARVVAPPKIEWGAVRGPLLSFLAVVAVFALGNSSDAFLVLRANNLGLDTGHVLLVYALFNAVSALIATPAGIASDRVGRRPIIIGGLAIFSLSYLGFALAKTSIAIWPLFAVYGIHVGMVGGVFRAFAVDLAPRELRGTVIGAYYAIQGTMLLLASTIAGALWKYVSPSAPFFYGATMAALAALLLFFFIPRESRSR